MYIRIYLSIYLLLEVIYALIMSFFLNKYDIVRLMEQTTHLRHSHFQIRNNVL